MVGRGGLVTYCICFMEWGVRINDIMYRTYIKKCFPTLFHIMVPTEKGGKTDKVATDAALAAPPPHPANQGLWGQHTCVLVSHSGQAWGERQV